MKKLIFTLFFMFLLCGNVKAASIEINDATFNSSSVPYIIRLAADTTYRPLFELYVDSTDAAKYNFGYMRICGTGEIDVVQDGDCTDGCLNDTINKVYNTSETCTVAERSGKVTYIFFSINEWEVGSGNTSIWTLKDYMIFKNISPWYSYFQITNVYLSDSNLYPTFQQSNSQNETNNKLDQQIQQNQTIIDKQDQINGSINNSNVDDPSGKFSQFESYLPENGVITQLITLPITLFQRVLSSINGTCSQYNLGNLLGTDLILPCINISNYIGSTLWNVIDVLFSGFFVLVIGKKMIKAFNNFTSMEEGDILD